MSSGHIPYSQNIPFSQILEVDPKSQSGGLTGSLDGVVVIGALKLSPHFAFMSERDDYENCVFCLLEP